MVEGAVASDGVVTLDGAGALQGSSIAINVEGDSVFANEAQVVLADIEASNGVLLPPANWYEFTF